jgi:hypothetical protein
MGSGGEVNVRPLTEANAALPALGELEAEIASRLGEPAVGQLRSTLLEILDG